MQTGSAVVLLAEVGHISSLVGLIAATAAANGGERLEETSPSNWFAHKTALFSQEDRNLTHKQSSGTKRRQSSVEKTPRFASFPLPERTAWLSFKKKKKKGVCACAV